MSKVMIFSREFPCYHHRKGEPTYFVEKIFAGFADTVSGWKIIPDFVLWDFHIYYNCKSPKWHTVRAGNHWKPGDKFSPRIWSGKPYRSKQIIIAPDIEVKKTWEFITYPGGYTLDGEHLSLDDLKEVAFNDGLSVDDFEDWFSPYGKKDKETCQIICWNENIEY